MLKINDINYIFTKKEIIFLFFIFFGVLSTTILDVLSFALIIPIFQIIFLNKIPEINFFNFLPSIINDLSLNLKIIILLFFIFIFFLKNSLIIIFNYFFINFFQKTNTRISSDLFSLFLNQEYIFFLKFSSENFLQKVTGDVNNLNAYLISLINFFTEIIFVIGISFLLIFVDKKIFVFSFSIFLIVSIIYAYFFKNKIKRWSINYRKCTGQTQNLVFEGLKGFKDIIIYKLNNHFVDNFNYNTNLSNHSLSRINFLNNVQKYWLEIVGVAAMSIALLFFVFADFNLSNLVPIFGLFIVVTFRLLSSFSRIILHGQNLKFYFPSFRAISDEFQRLHIKKDAIFNSNLTFKKTIELKNVSFSYLNNENKILENINFEFNKNECVCILGKNGSGKSTFLNLIAGLIKATDGAIIVDKVYDLYSNRIKWIEKLSYVQQNIFLLDSSIKNNITLENDEGKIDYIKYNKVLDILKLDNSFKDLSNGLNTKVGIDGISLSGGQKQLISLARALYKESEVLILDEPTSAFDSIKIELFRDLILSLKKITTIFLVTHNKDYFQGCFDKLIEIKSGKIILL
jgi:ABC-type multidrug transport system fused ATPase/permease subunit